MSFSDYDRVETSRLQKAQSSESGYARGQSAFDVAAARAPVGRTLESNVGITDAQIRSTGSNESVRIDHSHIFQAWAKELSGKIQKYHQAILQIEKTARNPPSNGTEHDFQILQGQIDAALKLQGAIAQELQSPHFVVTKTNGQQSGSKGLSSAQQDKLAAEVLAKYKAPMKKMRKDFEKIVLHLQDVILGVNSLRREYLLGYSMADEEAERRRKSSETEPEDIQFRKLENDMAHHEALLEEREEEFQKIHKNVVEVNNLFRDLAAIVESQQEGVETIENNAVDARNRTERGLEELQHASRLQKTCTIM